MKFLALFMFMICSIYSESLVLKDGRIVVGDVLDHDATTIKLKEKEQVSVYKREEIHKVYYTSDLEIVKKLVLQEKKATGDFYNEKNNSVNRRIITQKTYESKQESNKKIILLNSRIQKLERKIYNLQRKIQTIQNKKKDANGGT